MESYVSEGYFYQDVSLKSVEVVAGHDNVQKWLKENTRVDGINEANTPQDIHAILAGE